MKNYLQYVILAAIAAVLFFFGQAEPALLENIADSGHEGELLSALLLIALIGALSVASTYVAIGTPIPSFLIALFLGVAAQPWLAPIAGSAALVTFGAILILKEGGLGTNFADFKRLFWPIASLSVVGLLYTAFLFSLFVWQIGLWLGIGVSVAAAIFLGAILASTDPAAIIPVLQNLRFKNTAPKDMAISESALTDVTGALLTVAFLGIATGVGGIGESILDGYLKIFSAESGWFFLKQVLIGTGVGWVGYKALHVLSEYKKWNHNGSLYGADAVAMIVIGVLAFFCAAYFGGSGYLAAFVAGLLFHAFDHMKPAEHDFSRKIDGIAKPLIFLVLGASIDLQSLGDYALIGIISALAFMFIMRPLSVFLSLGVFFKMKKIAMTDMLFLSFVRETGAIPAVLLITVSHAGIPGIEALLPIGTWVILLTLLVQPPLTAAWARYLGIVETK